MICMHSRIELSALTALTLHQPYSPILISVLFHLGLQVLSRSFFYTQGVFGLDFISFLFAYITISIHRIFLESNILLEILAMIS